jgi:hypothetical protein
MMDEIVQVLAAKTATPPERVFATTLKGYPGFSSHELVGPGRMPWLLVTRVRSKPRLSPWLQYCPPCLQEDADPYFRRPWRLAFVTVCAKHRRRLLDGCPACGKPLNFHRLKANATAITLCYHCRFDLRRAQAPALKARAAHHALIQSQIHWIEAIEQGRCVLSESKTVNAKDYFLVLRQFGQLLTAGKHAQQRRQAFCQHLRQPYFEPYFPGSRQRVIEMLYVVDRFRVMLLLAWWLDRWPERFIVMCERADIRFTELMQGLHIRPEWYVQAVRQACTSPY